MDWGKILDRATAVVAMVATVVGATYAIFAYQATAPNAIAPPVGAMTMTPWWALALLGVGFVLAVLSAAHWILKLFRKPRPRSVGGRILTNPSIHFPTPHWHDPLMPVVNQQFRNEMVDLDGKHFVDCRFENVTFVYNGTKPVQFTNCGRPPMLEYTLLTDNPAISVTQELIHWLQVTSGANPATLIRNLTNRSDR